MATAAKQLTFERFNPPLGQFFCYFRVQTFSWVLSFAIFLVTRLFFHGTQNEIIRQYNKSDFQAVEQDFVW